MSNFSLNVLLDKTHISRKNISVGIHYNPRDEKGMICLLRLNGPHGGTKEIPHHEHFHIHKTSAETINEGIKICKEIELTEEYSALNDAIQYFVKRVNINRKDREKYFPKTPLELF